MSDHREPGPGRSRRTTVVMAIADSEVKEEVRRHLSTDPAIEVVADVGADAVGDDVLAVVGEHLPDVVVLGVGASVPDPTETCRRIMDSHPVCRVGVLAHGGDAPFGTAEAGAVAVFRDADEGDDLPLLVRGMARGEGVLSPHWAEQVLHQYAEFGAADVHAGLAPRLTATEREVLRRLSQGASATAIAGLHEVPVRLVRLHAGVALMKLSRHRRDVAELDGD